MSNMRPAGGTADKQSKSLAVNLQAPEIVVSRTVDELCKHHVSAPDRLR